MAALCISMTPEGEDTRPGDAPSPSSSCHISRSLIFSLQSLTHVPEHTFQSCVRMETLTSAEAKVTLEWTWRPCPHVLLTMSLSKSAHLRTL
jgi:hypothetical protein